MGECVKQNLWAATVSDIRLVESKGNCVCDEEESSVTRFGDFFWTLGNFLKPLAEINLPKSPTFLGKFCKGVKIFHFYSEIIFGQLLWTFGDFLLVTLEESEKKRKKEREHVCLVEAKHHFQIDS